MFGLISQNLKCVIRSIHGRSETTLNERDFRPASPSEQQVYDHLLSCVQVEPPSQVLERFRRLFIEGTGYYEQEIWLALEKIIFSRQVEQEFPFFFNRCCHILINHWQMQRRQQAAILELVALLENQPTPGLVPSRVTRRLRQLLKLFTETEQYLTLRRRAQVMSQGAETSVDWS